MTPTARVLGLDVSTKTGVARPDGSLTRIILRTPPSDPARRLHELRTKLLVDLRRYPPLPDLAVLEGASLGGPGVGSKITLAQLRAMALELLFALGVPVVEVRPSALKRYATGNGTASKTQIVAAARHEGAEPANDDEADAYFARHLGLLAQGMIDPTVVEDPDHRRHLIACRWEVASTVTWP